MGLWGGGAAAFDWQNVSAGQEAMMPYGTLRFVLGSQVFSLGYDNNGNMTTKLVSGARYLLTYDAENKLVSVSRTKIVQVAGAVTAIPRSSGQAFYYDGDGNRVKGMVAGTTTAFLGDPSASSGQGYFEWTGSTGTMSVRSRYYFAGSTRVAMRSGSTIKFLLDDHLGSTSITTDSNGVLGSTIMYSPWGGRRYSYGSIPTNYQYTDQRLESNFGLYFYNARWYDPALGRFIQADSFVQGGVQGLDRYAYTKNNPTNYTDPSGHFCTKAGPNSVCTADDDSLGWWAPMDSGELTDDGALIMQYYLQYNDMPGWWNNYTPGSFTLQQFVGMYILFESNTGYSNSTLSTADTLSIIFAQNLYMGGWNNPTCTYGGTCAYEVFNFIGANIDGNSALLKGPNSVANQRFAINNPGLGSPDEIRNLINSLGTKSLDPGSIVGDRYNGPSIWGNYNGATDIYNVLSNDETQIISYGSDVNTLYYFVSQNALYMSINQYNYWKNLNMDMTLVH